MNNFDWIYYIDKYPDLQKMRIDNKDIIGIKTKIIYFDVIIGL